MCDEREHLRAPILVALEAGVRLERGLQLILRDTVFMTVWQFVHIRPRVSWVLPCQLVRSPRSWQVRQTPLFSSAVRA